MYPYILWGDYKIYVVSVGILISIIVFLFLMWKFSKAYKLNFWKFFVWLPIFLFLMYFFGSYIYVVLNYKILIPTEWGQFLSLLFPLGYKFHFIGLSFAFVVVFLIFLSKQANYIERLKWIDVVFYSMMIAFFVLGIFLTLGDNFIGKPTDSKIGVSSLILCDADQISCFKPVSKLDDFIAVHPIGIYFSLLSIFIFVLVLILNFLFKRYGFGILGFVLFLVGLNIVFIFQQYPRYLPLKLGDITLDIKNYWTIALAVFIIFWYFLVYFKHRRR